MGAGRELFGRRKDGSEVPVEVRLTPIRLNGSALVLASVIDLTERPPRAACARRAADVRALVGELGAEFVNLRPDDVDRAIEDALGRVVRTLGLDRSALFQVDESGDFVHTHQWTRPGCPPSLPRVSARREFPWHLSQIRAGDLVSFATLDDVPDAIDRESLRRLGTKSAVTLPLSVAGQTWGALSFGTVREPRSWTPDVINRLRVVALIFANALARRVADEALRRTVDSDDRAARSAARRERVSARRAAETHRHAGHRRPQSGDPASARAGAPGGDDRFDGAAARRDRHGKGAARRAHPRAERPPRARDGARELRSPSAASIERELFGGEQNVAGARRSGQVGRLELANGSTVFLDEIADLPLEAQASLMRVLQDSQIQSPGQRPAR